MTQDAGTRASGDSPDALVINIMVEQWEPGLAPGLGPMGNPLPPGALDHQALGWAAYGPRTGVPQALALLERESVRATFYVSGVLTETSPGTVAAIAGAGHEVAAHAWAQNRVPALMTAAEEEQEVVRCARALEEVGGRRPRGWISPRCTPSARTAELLAGAGYDWFGDVFDADLPYELQTSRGSITALPFGLEVNDLPLTVRHGRPTRDLVTCFLDHARGLELVRGLGLVRDSAHVDVTLHAHVGCRPPGLLALREIIAEARRRGMRITTRGGLVDDALAGRGAPIPS